MRREYKQGQSYVDWLKSLGCVMYLPLSEGDLQDKISGEHLQLTGEGSMVWDATEQMYEFTQPSSNWKSVAYLDNGINKATFPEDNYTTLHSIKMVSNSSSMQTRNIAPNSYDGETTDAIFAKYNNSGKTSNFPRTLVHVAYVCNHTQSSRTCIHEGGIYNTYAEYSPYLPSNWVLNDSGIFIAITKSLKDLLNVKYYMKDIYLFNKALDLQTIRKIQGYE